MNNEKNKQRKWVREEVVILVTEYFKNKNLSVEEIKCSYYKITPLYNFLNKKYRTGTF